MKDLKSSGIDGASDPAVPSADRRGVLQSALAAIEKLQAQLAAVEDARHEPIAIVGLGCRVPGGVDDGASFWELLKAGRDSVGEVPPDRWDVPGFHDPAPGSSAEPLIRAGGFLDSVDGFDPAFFGISPREARCLDPQQRVLLEVAWEALEHAAIPADQLEGSQTGVFIGISTNDYSSRVDSGDPVGSDMYLATGIALNAAAGRISFSLGLQGPCIAMDTACSSSLVSIHTACQSLRNRESDLALAGGVNLMLSPNSYLLIAKWGMLAPDGRCKTFDASADGFVRGEGCGLVVLERLSDAIANGRRVLAVIRGSAINQDGRSSGLTVPNGLAQQAVYRRALAAARVRPADVSYIEAHGTGTSLGDPIEVEALAAVYSEGRAVDRPLEVGSVKSNVGHLEAAAGVAGLIKVVLCMQNGQLPASLHVRQPTPAIPWDSIPIRVSTAFHPWQPAAGKRIAGISAFGFTGMNAHVILEEYVKPVPTGAAKVAESPFHLLALSARSAAALNELALRYADHLRDSPSVSLGDLTHTAAAGRSALAHRLAVVAPDAATLEARLRAATAGEPSVIRGLTTDGERRRVAFLFTGQGSQYVGMAGDLYQTEPTFRAVIDRCAAVLDPLLGRPLLDLMNGVGGDVLDQTGYTQPVLYALEIALATMWRTWGVEPSVLVGHSVGEYAAAALAGVFSIEDGARLIEARGRLMQALPAGGVMISVQADSAADLALVESALLPVKDQVAIAAWNGPANVVISGARAQAEAVAAELADRGMRTQALVVSHAFHSPLMAPMIAEFERIAASIAYSAPRIAWISTLDGKRFDWNQWGSNMTRYWSEHVRSAVYFAPAMRTLASEGHDVCLEIGPHPVLTALGQSCVTSRKPITWLATLYRKRNAWEQVLSALGRLFVAGIRIDWPAFGAGRGHSIVTLPSYPFQRQRYWIDAPGPRRNSPRGSEHEMLGTRIDSAGTSARFEREIASDNPAWLADHRIAGAVLMPLTGYVEAALTALKAVGRAAPWELLELEIGEAMLLPDGHRRLMQVIVERPDANGRRKVRILSRDAEDDAAHWIEHTSLIASESSSPAGDEAITRPIADLCADAGLQELAAPAIDAAAMYADLRTLGFEFGESFRGMRGGWPLGAGVALADIDTRMGTEAAAGYLLHPALLDACLHAAPGAVRGLPDIDPSQIYLPVGLDGFTLTRPSSGPLRSLARVRERSPDGESIRVDLRIETATGELVALVIGLRCRRTSRDIFRQGQLRQAASWMHQVVWKAAAQAGDASNATGRWLLLDDGSARSERVAADLVRRGGTVTRVTAGPAFAASDPAQITIDAASPADYARMIGQVSAAGPLRGVVSLWPLRIPVLGVKDVPSENQQFGTDAGLLLVQSLAAATSTGSPRLWVVTGGSQRVDGSENIAVEQAPVAALMRVVGAEHPELNASLFDLDPQGRLGDERALVDELVADGPETQVAVRKAERHVARLSARPAAADAAPSFEPHRLVVQRPGTLDGLGVEPLVRCEPGPGEVELTVHAVGINFRDVLITLGLYPGPLPPLGSDCAGEISAVGPGVTRVKVGDRVMATAQGAFVTHAVTPEDFVVPLPESIDYEQGASLPSALLTADVTLNQIAGMKRGDRVLIHAGAGGVGMAAVLLARRAGAEIFATAGSDEKRDLLRAMGVQHVFDSRSTSFADDVMQATDGRGVDIVLNSLAGDMLVRSFDVLARGGTFLEIGKRDLMTHAQVEAMGRDLRYHIVDCGEMARDTPAIVVDTLSPLLAELANGELGSLPITTFRFDQASAAMRYMAQARHIGRVVLRLPVRSAQAGVSAAGTYLVTGGLSGLGLVTARWLVAEGARHLLLAGRRAPDATAQQAFDAMQQTGATVRVVNADVSTADGVSMLIARIADGMPPVAGVIHCAGMLDDDLLERQSPARFASVMKPKADAAWRLHHALAGAGHAPGQFVMFSSMSSIFGSPGQSNYVCANAFLDAFAQARQARGQAAISLNWGPWKETGMAARGDSLDKWSEQGVGALSSSEGTTALSLAMARAEPQLAVLPVRWSVFARRFAGLQVPPLLRDVIEASGGARSEKIGEASGAIPPATLAALSYQDRCERIGEVVRHELGMVLALADGGASIDDAQTFSSLGLDSLTAVELRNRLQHVFGQTLPATIALLAPTVAQMCELIAPMFGADPEQESGEPVDNELDRENLTL